MRKIGSFIASLLMASAWALPAHADTILFNPTGGGTTGALTIDLLDPTTGNAITTITSFNPDGTFNATVLFQANLGLATLNGALPAAYTDCSPTCFTFTASIDVIGSVSGSTITLNLDPTTTSTFYMYANDIPGVNLTGQCFASIDPACLGPDGLAGIQVATGDFTQFQATFTQTADNTTCTVGGNILTPCPLDAFNTNNYPGTTTIVGGGSIITADILITDFLSGYFPDLTKNASFFIASSEQKLPYQQVDPSACFSSNGVLNCNTPGVAAVGPINGNSTFSTMTQTDANVSFINSPAAVPEPASLVLLGTGLLGVVARRRRAAKK